MCKGATLILSYSNVYSFWKQFEDVYIGTRCSSIDKGPHFWAFTAFTTSWVFSVGSLFYSRAQRMCLLFVFLCPQGWPVSGGNPWPCCNLASSPLVLLLEVTPTHNGPRFQSDHVPVPLQAFFSSPMWLRFCSGQSNSELMLSNREAGFLQETQENEPRASKECGTLQKCQDPKILFLGWADSTAR